MAFSTQRTFLTVPFRNEQPGIPDRKRSDCQLQSYESCTDSRAWSIDPKVCSKFLLDVVHKARRPSQLRRPTGDFELTREYLLQLGADELVDYIMSLMHELKQLKSSVATLEVSRKELGQQLDSVQQIAESCQQEREELVVKQQLSMVAFDPNHLDQEMVDLKMAISSLKEKAAKYDCLLRENECLRAKMKSLCDESATQTRKSVDEGACGDFSAFDCERLEAELRIYIQEYKQLKHQKLSLMEELEKVKLDRSKISSLKDQLQEEQAKRYRFERKLEDVQIELDRLQLNLTRKDEYIAMCNQRLERIQPDRRWSTASTSNRPEK